MIPTDVLVATDLSDLGMIALPHAAAFAAINNASLTLLYANEWADVEPVQQQNKKRERLDTVRRTVGAMGLEPQIDIVDGPPETVISRYMKHSDVDLVVVTRHGASVGQPLHQSVASRVVRDAPCPVLVVHGPADRKPEVDVAPSIYRRVFVSTDFSYSSDRGVEEAAAIASQFGAELVIGHCVEVPGLHSVEGDKVIEPTVPPAAQASVEQAKQSMLQTASNLAGSPPTVVAQCADEAAEGIVAMALLNRCDLIVIPSHGKSAVFTFFLGSVAQRVLDLSPLPVLVLRRGSSSRRPD